MADLTNLKKEAWQFIKLNLGSCLSWAITFAWLIYIFFKIRRGDLPSALNEFGDFIAGAFAPLAFFWLVRGFYQQGKGLEQNSEALKLQAKELNASTHALNLQAHELKNSVNEQKNLIHIQQQEQAAKHFSVLPFLSFKGEKFKLIDEQHEILGDHEEVLDVVVTRIGEYEIIISNEGEPAKVFSIIDPYTSIDIKSKIEIGKNEKATFIFHLSEDDLEALEKSNHLFLYFHVKYYDTYGKLFEFTIRIKISRYFDDSQFYVNVEKYGYKKDISKL